MVKGELVDYLVRKVGFIGNRLGLLNCVAGK